MDAFLSSLGQTCAVIGAQWGDEGKGKVTDILAGHFDVIARACGGANAGHTIVVEGKKHVFHLLPSGCLHKEKPVILGAGMVIHLPTLLEEIDTLKKAGVDIMHRLHISPAAHIVFDFHKEVDGAMEERRLQSGSQKIGTTKRGIGPAYIDKAARTGIRMESLKDDLSGYLASRAQELEKNYGIKVDVQKELEHMKEASALLASRIEDTVRILHMALDDGKKILIEGAQGSLLDIDHGSYPYVTSSSTTTAGALQGLGLPPQALTSCVGVAKAYCTRVGEGDFPTEADADAAKRLRDRGGEYGATTGRPRRCGWLCIADLAKAARLNGITHWNLTKLDVLDEEEEIPIGCIGEEGVRYEKMPGWKQSTVGVARFADLPKGAQNFIASIEKMTGLPVSLIGTGPDREDMIVR